MKKYTFLLALLLIAIFSSKEAMAVELDTVWVSDIKGQVLFQHPVTKNILVAANGGITELNNQDGKFVRSFPLNTENTLEMSPDGTKMLYYFWEDTKFIIELYDYNTQKVIFKTAGLMPKFLDNNNFVFLLPSDGKQVNLNKCKIEKQEITKQPIFSNGPVTAFSASPNGKYIAYATYEKNNTTDSRAYLYLLDAETMQGLGELGSWDSNGQEIQDITFSPNSKYLTYNIYYTNTTPINIYEIENKSIFKSINSKDIENGSAGFEFIGNDYYSQVSFSLSNNKYDYGIYKIGSHEVIYQSDNIYNFFYNSKLNSILNHLTYNNRSYNVVCIDFSKIISGVSQVNSFNIKYINKTLVINNTDKPINNISIMTNDGREVFKQKYERLTFNDNQIEIPLALSNGLYLISITSSNENLIHKLLIKE